MNYTVIRTDLLSGTKQPADLVSLRFYDGDEPVAVENGVIAKLEGLEDGEREVHRAVAASADDNLNDCVIVAGVEVMYDERKRNLSDFINEAGSISRGYIPRSRNIASWTAEGFVGAPPAKDATVGIGAGGKLDASADGFGVCIDVENTGRYTYYVIQIGPTEV